MKHSLEMITNSKLCLFYVCIETIHYSYKMVGEKPVTHAICVTAKYLLTNNRKPYD